MQENHRKLLLDQISKPADQFEINKFRRLFSTLHRMYDGKEIGQEVSEVILENLYQNIDLSKTKIFATSICEEFPDLRGAIIRKLQDDWESNKFPDRYLPILLFLQSRRGFRHIFEQVKEDISQDPLRKKAYSAFLEMIAEDLLVLQNIPRPSKKISKSDLKAKVYNGSRPRNNKASKSELKSCNKNRESLIKGDECADQIASKSPNLQSKPAERIKCPYVSFPVKIYGNQYTCSTGGIDISIPQVGALGAITTQKEPVGKMHDHQESDDSQKYIRNLENDHEKLKNEFRSLKKQFQKMEEQFQEMEEAKEEEIANLRTTINRLENDKKSLQESRDIRLKEEQLQKRQSHNRK